MSSATTYRFAPALVARLVGAAFVGLAVLVFVLTAVSGILDLSLAWVGLAGLIGAVVVTGVAWWITRNAWVVKVDDQGYRVRGVRGVGRAAGSWDQVRRVSATEVAGAPCLVLQGMDGHHTTIPVSALAVDREQFVREVRARLRQARKAARAADAAAAGEGTDSAGDPAVG